MEETTRLAFGHLLDQDGCDENDVLSVDVMGAASGDNLCTVTLASEDPVQSLKAKIAVTLNLPESDQILLLPTGQRLGAKRRLRSVIPSAGRSASVTLVVSRPSCRCCGVKDGLWGRRAKLIRCARSRETYSWSRKCMIADEGAHFRRVRP